MTRCPILLKFMDHFSSGLLECWESGLQVPLRAWQPQQILILSFGLFSSRLLSKSPEITKLNILHTVILWITASCSLVLVSSSGLRMKATGSSEKWVPNYDTVTLCYQTHTTHTHITFQVRNVVNTFFKFIDKISDASVLTPHSLTSGYRCFGGICCLLFRIEFCTERNRLAYVHKLQRRRTIRHTGPTGGEQEMKPGPDQWKRKTTLFFRTIKTAILPWKGPSLLTVLFPLWRETISLKQPLPVHGFCCPNFNTEDGGSMFLRNYCIRLQICTVP
jgi:hypothetical protein